MRTFYLILVLLAFGCQNDPGPVDTFTFKVRLDRDPERINPIFAPSAVGREVFQYIFLPLAEFHPETLELVPVVAKAVPVPEIVTDPGRENQLKFSIEIRKEAVWSDGTPITGKDFDFTVKALKHPNSQAAAWKPYLAFIKDVIVNAEDPKQFDVYADKDYMLSLELVSTMYIIPVHIYDPENKTGALSVSDYNDRTFSAETDTTYNAVIDAVNGMANVQEGIVQSGAYTVDKYEANQFITLKRIPGFWGKNQNPYLEAYPEEMVFMIIPDETSALAAMKEGAFDLMKMRNTDAFLEFRNEGAETHQFFTPLNMMYLYLAMNNQSPILSDVRVRQALAHCIDVDDIIQNIDGGLGLRTIGHFNPSKSYYNDEIEPIKRDNGKAKDLLSEAGWTDTDGDFVLDKTIDGTRESLKLDLLISGSELGRKVALIFKDGAKDVGVDINIVQKQMSLMRKENLSNFNFDMAALAVTQDAAPDDPYPRWHSDNAKTGGTNFCGYINPRSDALMDEIRVTLDPNERKTAYMELQEIMYEDQPVIFLYSPLQKIVMSNKFTGSSTAKRPGYLANTFQPNG